jgi:integrase
MSEQDSTTSASADKPAKPYPDYPLTQHPAGYWCKKIRGKLYYFGKLDDPDAALAKYLDQKDDLHAGREPRADPNALTIKELANTFLAAKQDLVDNGELSPRMWKQYKETCDEIVAHFGKQRIVADLVPNDFAALRRKLAARWQALTLGNFIQRVRIVFKFASDNDLIARPVRYGSSFKRPSKKTLRIEKAKQGYKLFTSEEVRRLLDAASVPLRAMILLGINSGFGNADCGRLPKTALDLDRSLVDYAREKTGIPRRCPLWPETVSALKEAIAQRPEPKDPAGDTLVFVTRWGQSWHTDTSEAPVSYEFGKLLRKLKINGRKGLGFYTLRHTFRTVADEAKDQPAADFLMGHESTHMSSHYRETISDERLRAVTDHVRAWLFGEPAKAVQ